MNTIENVNVTTAPWHKESYERFVKESLPALLAGRLPLSHYSAERGEELTWRIGIAVNNGKGAETVFVIPSCDDDGVFHIGGQKRVVLPVATAARLDEGEILCGGEQLLKLMEERVIEPPAQFVWNEGVLRNWVGLEEVVGGMVAGRLGAEVERLFGWGTVQVLDDTNWLSGRTHLRRVLAPRRRVEASGSMPHRSGLVDSSEPGRVCPFETPEGPNIGRVLSLARGAVIRDRRIVCLDESPVGKLGLSAGMVPCLQHTDANRLLMGVNMMRQWLRRQDPEPALVQTGLEPAAADFWCGRNLLTAYMSLGIDTYEDAIVVSESAARKLGIEGPVEAGDKLSNRHGQKGVISAIWPDEKMPHLADGRAVELVYSFIGLLSRQNYGQVREAVLGLLADAEGEAIVSPPFGGLSDEELMARLKKAGLREDGMQVLRDLKAGEPFARPTAMGYVYWGLTVHQAAKKLTDAPQTASFVQYQVLRELGAYQTIREEYGAQAVGCAKRTDGTAPAFHRLQQRLGTAGIAVEFDGKIVRFAMRSAEAGETAGQAPPYRLARPVPHPWLPEVSLAHLFVPADFPGLEAVVAANERIEQLTGAAPASLVERATGALNAAVERFVEGLLAGRDLEMSERVVHSGRAVIAPAVDITLEQCCLPDELAWRLFALVLAREFDAPAIAQRTPEAAAALDRIMGRSWVIINREPVVVPTAVIAFRPVRRPGNVIRLHPLCCPMLNADHDGDQVAVFLPVTEAGQREAAEKLSVAAHLHRDAGVINWAMPRQEMLLGLAWLSLCASGRERIAAIAGTDCTGGGPFVSAASLRKALEAILAQHGPEETMRVSDALMRLGFDAIRRSGMSFNPFAHRSMPRPAKPEPLTPETARATAEAMVDAVISRADYDALHLGPQILGVKAGARGNTGHVISGLICRTVADHDGHLHFFNQSLLGGLSPEAVFLSYVTARIGLAEVAVAPWGLMRRGYGVADPPAPAGFHVLARAMRSLRPGTVFARAALNGEVDPLTDIDARLFVGLAG